MPSSALAFYFASNPVGIFCIYTDMNRLLLFAFSLILMASSCPTQDTSPVNFPEEVLACLNHDVYSYWVYEESQTGVLDSVFVIKSKLGRDLVPDQYQRDAPERLSQSLRISLYHTNLFGNGPQYEEVSEIALYSWEDGLTEWMRSAFLEADFPGTSGYSRDTVFSSYEVAGIAYDEVVQITDSADHNFSGALSHNFYAPGFALVRKEIPSVGSIWNLKKAYIRQ